VVGTFSAEMIVSQPAELVINQRHESTQRLLITGPPLD
jgi:hypothetical protein